MSKRGWWISASAMALMLLCGAAIVWFVLMSPGRSADRPPAEVAAEVTQALEALETDPAALLPAELQEEFGADVDAALPVGTTVVADPESWEPSAAGGGVIMLELTFPDGTSQSVFAVMVQEDGAWKVLQTLPIEGTP